MYCAQYRLYRLGCAVFSITIISTSLLAVAAHSQEQFPTKPVSPEPSSAALSCTAAVAPERELPFLGEDSEEGHCASSSSSLVQRTQSIRRAPFHAVEEQRHSSQVPVSEMASEIGAVAPPSAPQHDDPKEHLPALFAALQRASAAIAEKASAALLAVKDDSRAAAQGMLRRAESRDVAKGFMLFILLALLVGLILFGGAMGVRSPPTHGRMQEASSRKQREEGGGCGGASSTLALRPACPLSGICHHHRSSLGHLGELTAGPRLALAFSCLLAQSCQHHRFQFRKSHWAPTFAQSLWYPRGASAH